MASQRTETRIACRILNTITDLGDLGGACIGVALNDPAVGKKIAQNDTAQLSAHATRRG